MNAGLPTTGIGGIFYFASVVIMLLVEIITTLKGKSSIKRWKFVTGQVLLVSSIIGASWATAFLISKALPVQIKVSLTSISTNSSVVYNSQRLFLTPFIILAILLVSMQILRVFFVLRKKYN